MASKRELKKDIRTVTELIIADALELASTFDKEADKKKVMKVIFEVADLHNSLISRVNKPDGKDNPKLAKAHYNSIIKDMMEKTSKAYEKLGLLVKG